MIQVLKFGGSSVANATNISRVIDIVSAAAQRGRVVLITSAISGCTDRLIELGATSERASQQTIIAGLRDRHHAIINRLFTGAEKSECEAEVDSLFEGLAEADADLKETYGELFATKIIERKLSCEGLPTLWIDSRDLITTRGGSVDEAQTYDSIRRIIEAHPEVEIFVAPGFIASDETGRPTTLGRGGSDYSAALYAAALHADKLEIWTDVPGIMTTNPRDTPAARTITTISYTSALDMASHGAKVLYAPTVKPAMDSGIAFSIRNTFDPANPGTLVCSRSEDQVPEWKGVAMVRNITPDTAQICLVGEGITNVRQAEQRILAALKVKGIKPSVPISRTEWGNFLIDVRSVIAGDAVQAIHKEFFESSTPTVIDIFIAGYGAVGRSLIRTLERSSERIARRLGRRIRIVGLSDSKHYVIDLHGIEPGDASRRLSEGQSAADRAYIKAICECATRKAVFVDCTNDPGIFVSYMNIFRQGMSVVTSNRRSIAVAYAEYESLKITAQENGASFRYDTSVGTALPILESIASEANCSDTITSIEAVVSCTLNYLITGYKGDGSATFADRLREAQESGLTEEDPRADIGGQDALRKLLILAREAGVPLEAADVEVRPLLGPEFFDCDIETFYERLASSEQQLRAQENDLKSRGLRQRFVASIHRDPAARVGYKATIGMQVVGEESPFYYLAGTENVTVITSQYSDPLVIKGPGEGADLAAAGIIKDILM